MDTIVNMPPPTGITGPLSFLGAIQFYRKFIPNLTTITEPLTHLTHGDMTRKWGEEKQAAFQLVKTIFSKDVIHVHYDPHLDIGISCDASNVGIGTVLFHCYPNGREHLPAHALKTLSPTQHRYSQIQWEALTVIFGLKKFYHFLYGRKFILVIDHKPLVAMFNSAKATPTIAANRLV